MDINEKITQISGGQEIGSRIQVYGLPAPVIKECIVGAIEARFDKRDAELTHDAPKRSGIKDCCADGIAEATACSIR